MILTSTEIHGLTAPKFQLTTCGENHFRKFAFTGVAAKAAQIKRVSHKPYFLIAFYTMNIEREKRRNVLKEFRSCRSSGVQNGWLLPRPKLRDSQDLSRPELLNSFKTELLL